MILAERFCQKCLKRVLSAIKRILFVIVTNLAVYLRIGAPYHNEFQRVVSGTFPKVRFIKEIYINMICCNNYSSSTT